MSLAFIFALRCSAPKVLKYSSSLTPSAKIKSSDMHIYRLQMTLDKYGFETICVHLC